MNSYYQNAGIPGLATGSRSNQIPSYYPTNQNFTTPTNNLIWVQGIEGAKAHQLTPNSMAILLDSESEGTMYIKVSDNIGICSLRIFNYKEVLPSEQVTINKDLDLSQFVKKDELTELIKEIIDNERQSIPAVAETTASQSNVAPTAAKPKVIIQQSSK